MSDRGSPLWDRVEAALATPVANTASEQTGSPRSVGKGPKVYWKTLDVFATLLWSVFLVKLFVADVDRWLVSAISPAYVWLLDFRFLATLALVSILLIATRKKRRWLAVYLILFPLIAVFWKIPKFLYKRRSWSLAIGVVHVTMGTFKRLPRFLIVATLVLSAATIILLRAGEPMVIAAIVVLILMWAINLGLAAFGAFRLDSFVGGQNKTISKILHSKAFWNMVRVDDVYRNEEVVEYTREQATQLVTKAAMGVVAARATELWATKLDGYRRSPAFVLFGSLTVVGLFIHVVFTSALINYGLHQVDPKQFSSEFEPSLSTFFYYAFSAALAGEINGFVPRGMWAISVHIGTGFSAAVLLLVLVVSLIFGVKQSRTDESAMAAIGELRRVSEEFESRIAKDYGMEPDGLRSRLIELEGIFGRFLAYLARQMGVAAQGRTEYSSKTHPHA